jgi:D-serine deaminase-like pyridoxal phosphate-dependent protein
MQQENMWYRTDDEASVFTPAVLLYPDRIEENIRRMVAMAGHPGRLRPHVKTHKIAELITLQKKMGISRFKCATLTELEMVAARGGADALLAYPLLGPDIQKFIQLTAAYPMTRLAATVDSLEACQPLAWQARSSGQVMNLFVDLDTGMHRTGIVPGLAMELIEYINKDPWLVFGGLHIYDGHIHERDPEARRMHCEADFEGVRKLISQLKSRGIAVGELACGGTPTFPIHARHAARTLCPGTPVLWDAGYEAAFPDLKFLPAAVIASRVISQGQNQFCIDLGYKALASEMPHPRMKFLNLEYQEVITHSEEHLVLSPKAAGSMAPGGLVYALPIHICPTMALHEQVYVVRENKVVDVWKVEARKRVYRI